MEQTSYSKTDIPGMILRLGDSEVYWATPGRSICLSRLTVNGITGKVTKEVSDEDIDIILAGIRYGKVTVVDKLEESPAESHSSINIPFAVSIRAYRLLDTKPVEEFREAVLQTTDLHVVDAALGLEKREKNRGEYIKILQAKLKG